MDSHKFLAADMYVLYIYICRLSGEINVSRIS